MSTDHNDDEHKSVTPAHAVPKPPAEKKPGRHKNGRFEKGFTGNSRGRPRKLERAWSNRELISDILLEANAEVPVARGGTIEHIPMHRLIMRRLFLQAAKGDLRALKIALEYIGRAQSGKENRDWKFHQELEQVEKSFNELSALLSDADAVEHRNKWRRKSRKI